MKTKLEIVPFNTQLERSLLEEVVKTLQGQYGGVYSDISLRAPVSVDVKSDNQIFYREIDDSWNLLINTNSFATPTKIFRDLQNPWSHVLAVTDLPLYDPLQNNGFYTGCNGVINPDLGTGVMTSRKFLGELNLTLFDKIKSLVFHTDPSFKRRFQRVFKSSKDLFLDKLKFLSVHETGHFHYLTHCLGILEDEKSCAMGDSTYLTLRTGRLAWTKPCDYDLQGYRLCGHCKSTLRGRK